MSMNLSTMLRRAAAGIFFQDRKALAAELAALAAASVSAD